MSHSASPVQAFDLADLLPRPGRKDFPRVRVVGALGEADVRTLKDAPGTLPRPALQRIREGHHALARFVAEGKRDGEVAALTGYSPVRVFTLRQDPTFQELVAFYKTQIGEKFLDLHERLARVGTMALEEIQERLTDEPESLSLNELNETAKMALDRSGFGPTSKTSATVQHGFDPEALARIKDLVLPRGTVSQVQDMVQDADFVQIEGPKE